MKGVLTAISSFILIYLASPIAQSMAFNMSVNALVLKAVAFFILWGISYGLLKLVMRAD